MFVLHFGSSTFEATVFTIGDEIVEAESTAGDTSLGGKEFTNALVSHVVKRLNLDRTSKEQRRTLFPIC